MLVEKIWDKEALYSSLSDNEINSFQKDSDGFRSLFSINMKPYVTGSTLNIIDVRKISQIACCISS